MKSLISVFVITCIFVFPISAKENFDTAHELFEYWEYTAYPDYICGVWSNDGSVDDLTFAVVEGEEGERGKEEVLELIKDDSTVKFEYQKYTKNYLLSIIDEMNKRFCEYGFAADVGFSVMGLNEFENRVEITLKNEKETYQPTIDFVAEITERFGEAVCIEFSALEIPYTFDDSFALIENLYLPPEGMKSVSFDTSESKNSALETNLLVICIILAISLSFLSAAFVLQRRRLLRISGGGNACDAPVSRKEIEKAVQESNIDLPSGLDKKIMKRIDD